MTDTRKYKVLIIEPSQIVSAGLTYLFGQNKSFSIISTLSSLAYFNAEKYRTYDMILINPSVINYDSRCDVRSILTVSVDIPLFAISYSPYEEEVIHQYDGCIYIFDTKESIIKKIRNTLESVRQTNKSDNNTLSSRERDILTVVAKGLTNKEIADKFHISIYTVITHRKNISRKLGINTISGLTVYAILNKLIDTADF